MNNEKYDIAILGAGESGVGAALLAKKQGVEPFVSDAGPISDAFKQELINANIAFEESGHSLETLHSVKEWVKSPGIPDSIPLIKDGIDAGIAVISEIEFAYRYFDGKIMAVTGSNGKTTTTSLIYHVLKTAGKNVGLGGNIGTSFARLILDHTYEMVVLELSSFQLDGIVKFRPDVAVVTNISPDHLDRYDYDIDKYIASKFRITENQVNSDVLVHYQDGQYISDYLAHQIIVPQKVAFDVGKDIGLTDEDFARMPLQGPHNRMNMMAAYIATEYWIEEEVIKEAFETFETIPHRLQYVAEVEKVRYYNDSKATNVDAVLFALQSFDEPVVWIAGGVDKGNDYSVLEEHLHNVKALVCLGTDNSKLLEFFGGKINPISEASSMKEALDQATDLCGNGDVVLLSPACASFDLFKNYEDRGEQFCELVHKMMDNKLVNN